MKFAFPALLLVASALAQTPAVPQPPPQPSVPAVKPDAVVVTIDGKKYTAAEIDKLVETLPPQWQNGVRSNPQVGLRVLFMMKHLAQEAEKENLDKASPNKEALEFGRTQLLSNAEITNHRNLIEVTDEEQQKYYQTNKDKYRQAKVKVIYVAFTLKPSSATDPNAKKTLSENEAKAKAEDLRKKILAGADFTALAKENSDDKESAAKGGDFGTINRTSQYPDDIKNAVFALKPGEVSQPLRQPNGYYLIRLEEMNLQPYADVRVQIYEELKQATFDKWMKGLEQRYQVQIENPNYFAPRMPVAVPTPQSR